MLCFFIFFFRSRSGKDKILRGIWILPLIFIYVKNTQIESWLSKIMKITFYITSLILFMKSEFKNLKYYIRNIIQFIVERKEIHHVGKTAIKFTSSSIYYTNCACSFTRILMCCIGKLITLMRIHANANWI